MTMQRVTDAGGRSESEKNGTVPFKVHLAVAKLPG